MPRLKLRSIKCIESQEHNDELYVTFNGTKRSLPNMTDGVTKSLNAEFMFSGKQRLRLYENDGDHWYDRDDYIGSHDILDPTEMVSLRYKGDGAEYELVVSVFSDAQPPQLAILRLNSITCLEQAETFTDELYITFNGTKRSLPDMTKGMAKTLSDEFLFDGFSQLTLFENDGDHWYDRDDFIGTYTITRMAAQMNLLFEAPALIGKNPYGGAYPAKYELNVTIEPVDGVVG